MPATVVAAAASAAAILLSAATGRSGISALKQLPIVNLLHTPRLAAGQQDKPAVHELVENVPHDVKIEQAWIGDGLLTLPVCRGEEVSDLAPVRCGKGIRASLAYIVDDLKTLKNLR